MRQYIAAKAVIVNEEGRVLLLREASAYKIGTNIGKYLVPGGRIDADEKIYDALHREVQEEAGVAVEVVRPVYVDEWFPTLEGEPSHIVAIFFACKLKPGQTVTLNEEHDHYLWVDPKNTPAECELPDSIKQLFAEWQGNYAK